MPIDSYWPDSQSWERYWMASIVAVIAVIQLFISFAIMGLQSGIVGIGIIIGYKATERYVMGFICWAFFLSCWISTFCVTCCNRSSVGCATYVLVKNVLAFIFSAVLIDYNKKFIDLYSKLDYDIFINLDDRRSLEYTDIQKYLDILNSLSKAQLACAVIILVASLAYVGIYIYVYIRSIQNSGRISNANFPIRDQAPVMYTTSYQTAQPNQMPEQQRPSWKVQQASGVIPNALNSSGGTPTVVCHKCGATVNISPTHF